MPVSENAPIIWAIATLATCGVIPIGAAQ